MLVVECLEALLILGVVHSAYFDCDAQSREIALVSQRNSSRRASAS